MGLTQHSGRSSPITAIPGLLLLLGRFEVQSSCSGTTWHSFRKPDNSHTHRYRASVALGGHHCSVFSATSSGLPHPKTAVRAWSQAGRRWHSGGAIYSCGGRQTRTFHSFLLQMAGDQPGSSLLSHPIHPVGNARSPRKGCGVSLSSEPTPGEENGLGLQLKPWL